MKISDIKVGQKIFCLERDERIYPGTITVIWDKTDTHSAGFRADIFYRTHVTNAEFKEDALGYCIFLSKEDAEEVWLNECQARRQNKKV